MARANRARRGGLNQKTFMNPKETIPLLAKLAPVLAVAGPPALIGVALGLGLLWLFSGERNPAPVELSPAAPKNPAPAAPQTSAPVSVAPLAPPPVVGNRRITREDLAEALAYGARSMTRQAAVAALQALGFGKTAAYKALSPDGRFAEFVELTPDGLIEWKG